MVLPVAATLVRLFLQSRVEKECAIVYNFWLRVEEAM